MQIIRDVRYPAIDGLRFYAAFLVFLVHLVGGIALQLLKLPPQDYTPGAESLLGRTLYFIGDGGHGVDIFFIISGFLVGRLALAKLGEPFRYGRFVGKRFLRIYPAFLASLVISTAYLCIFIWWAWGFLWPDFLANLVFLNAIPSLGFKAYNHVTWSLGYEFAYYLFLPVVRPLAKLLGPRLGAGVFLVLGYLLVPDEYGRMIGLFAGTLLAAFKDHELSAFARRIPLAIAVLPYAIVATMKGIGLISDYSVFLYSLIPAVILLFVKVAFDDNVLSRLAAAKPLRALGTLSYSFYLFHSLGIMIAIYQVLPALGLEQESGLAIPVVIIASLAISLALAAASYWAFESLYFEKRKANTAPAQVTPVAEASG